VQHFASTERKVITIDEAQDLSRHQRKAGRTVGLTNGCFDILHSGHLDLLERARSMCDLLVVGVNSDESVRLLKGPDRPINSQADRARVIAGLECVGAVVIFNETTAEDLITRINPSRYFKGADYNPDNLPEYNLLQRLGIPLVLLSLKPGKSTTSIINRIASANRHHPSP
jgi:rfaE bifunctional protein nucleotidyltransferase chain/domain